MAYKIRNDIVLEKVAGVNMLIAKRSAWGTCPFIIEIGPMEAYFWKALNDGEDEKEMLAFASEKWKVKHSTAEKFYSSFISGIKKNNYLLSGNIENES